MVGMCFGKSRKMTNEEKQQLKARFFGMHKGAKFVSPCFSGDQINIGCYDEIEDGRLHARVKGIYGWYALELCELILRPLNSITDEEAIEAFSAAGIYGIEVFRDSDKIGIIGRNGISAAIWIKTSPLPVGRFLEAWNNFPNRPQPECFEYMLVDWLRSKHFCLPFCGLDPIQEGWAILETDNQPQP